MDFLGFNWAAWKLFFSDSSHIGMASSLHLPFLLLPSSSSSFFFFFLLLPSSSFFFLLLLPLCWLIFPLSCCREDCLRENIKWSCFFLLGLAFRPPTSRCCFSPPRGRRSNQKALPPLPFSSGDVLVWSQRLGCASPSQFSFFHSYFFFLATTYNTGLTLSLSGFEFVCSDVLMIQDGIGVKMP